MRWEDWVTVAIIATWVVIGGYEARRGNWHQTFWAVFWILFLAWWLF